MRKELKFHQIIETIIGEINGAKETSKLMHTSGDIKASGDEIENLIREKISLFLPERYMVKHGHIVNSEGKVSNQLDIIIFDRLNTPKFFESKNETVYYPIESVLAIGEIKKTLRKNDIIEFRKKIKYLKEDMNRQLIKNSVYGNQSPNKISISDMVNMRTDRKYKNPFFSFIFAIDEENIESTSLANHDNYLPNDIFILNYGCLLYGEFNPTTGLQVRIEDENPKMDKWVLLKKPDVFCLATMFNQLINHLNKCHIEPFSISNYMLSKADFGIKGSHIINYGSNLPNN